MDFDLIVEMILSILGGLGLFLLGMKNMSEGMQAVAGNRMRALINAVTNNRFVACAVGVLVTCMIQSSSVTTVMVVGMVNAGLMTLMQAIGVILGADIGTTITGWILVLKISKYGLPLIGLSAFFYLFAKKERVRFTAMMILGLGMVFFGLELMKKGFNPIKDMPEFLRWFSMFTPDSYIGVLKCCLIGAFVTAIVQSSSATLGITMGLASTGVIGFDTAVALVLGENIGTTITAYLASLGTSTEAKRAAIAHVIIKVVGVGWITALFPFYIGVIKNMIGIDPSVVEVVDGVENFPNVMKGIAISHTGFNIINVIVLMPFMSPLAKLLCRIIPGKGHREIPHLKFIDIRMLEAPAIGIQQSSKEIQLMASGVQKMLSRLKRIIQDGKKTEEASLKKIFHREEVLDIVQKEVVEFLSKLLSGSVTSDIVNRGRMQLRMADEYESISDYVTQVLKLYLKLEKSNLELTDTAKNELIDIHNQVASYIEFVNDAVANENTDILSKATTRSDIITHMIKDCRNRHLSRVGTDQTTALKSLFFTDILTSYRRIKDHAFNIAEAQAGEK